jgi:hypothetical protein
MFADIHSGFRVKETEKYYIDVVGLLFGWRLCCTNKELPNTCGRSWDYVGRGGGTLFAAIRAAQEWDGSDDTEPIGWNRNNLTGEWRKSS